MYIEHVFMMLGVTNNLTNSIEHVFMVLGVTNNLTNSIEHQVQTLDLGSSELDLYARGWIHANNDREGSQEKFVWCQKWEKLILSNKHPLQPRAWRCKPSTKRMSSSFSLAGSSSWLRGGLRSHLSITPIKRKH
jgi:hypothetical protein